MADEDIKTGLVVIEPATLGAQPRAAPATDAVVEAWFVETFHGLPIDTSLFNRFFAAKERLKSLLAKE